ncbi:ferrous iron transport protein A [Rhizobium sp. S-51]|uniref:Ferrous iron transport protein A n=2 Tax=Rhizobium terricola TaxID=2728849 RepID=A0A7Y0AVM9_9HYPH|nr:ferrous iron transport protein A [Rhizobium terricola]
MREMTMMTQTAAYPLTMARPGERVRIVALAGGRSLDRRLTDLGLALGSIVRIVQNQMTGPMIVAIHESRVGLGMGMAQKLTVEPIKD